MRTPRPLPPPLLTGVVTRRALERHGVGRHRLYARDLVEVARGMRTADPAALRPWHLARELCRQIPDAVVCGVTAAQFHGIRLPWRLQQSVDVHLAKTGGDRIRRRGITGSWATYAPGEVVDVDGMRVTTPERTFFDLASVLDDVDLVVCGDGLINAHATGIHRGRPPVCSGDELRALVERHAGERGARRCREALLRMRSGSDSAYETRLRLRLEDHDVGIWTLDHAFRGADGVEVTPDLWEARARVSVQYDGAHHDQRGQRVRDIRRQRRTESAGAIEVRIVAEDLDVQERWCGRWVPRAVVLVAEAVERGLARRRRRETATRPKKVSRRQ